MVRPTTTLRETVPARYFLFDCLHLDGIDLTARPYVERRAALDSLGLGRESSIVVPPSWPDLDGQILLDIARDLALEGSRDETIKLHLSGGAAITGMDQSRYPTTDSDRHHRVGGRPHGTGGCAAGGGPRSQRPPGVLRDSQLRPQPHSKADSF